MTGAQHERTDGPARDGFTIIEVIIALVIMGVMAVVAFPSLGDAVTNRRAQNARNDLVYVASRAQMAAVERGEMVRLSMDPSTDVLTILAASGDTVEVFDMRDQDDADLLIEGGTLHVCYSPMGFAHPSCSDTSDSIGVAVGGHTLWSSLSATGAVRPK